MMSTQNQAEHGVIHSSIALLQERFRQLQRVKEMREKKPLLRLFSDNYNINIPSSDSSCLFELSSSSSPITTSAATTTTTTTTAATKNDDDVVMVDDNGDDDDDELHIFLPPNYYYTNYNSRSNNSNKPTSCYSSSLLSLNNNTNNNKYQDLYPINRNISEISLSLWPPTISYNNVNGGGGGGGGSMEAPVSTLRDHKLPSSCLSAASKLEESPHVSDIDTTLHL